MIVAGIAEELRMKLFSLRQAGVLAAFLIAAVFSPSDSLAAGAPLTVEDFLKQERIGKALFRPGRDEFVFEVRGAYKDRPKGGYKYGIEGDRWASELMRAESGDKAGARPLFAAEADTLYALASFSPDGDRLLFFAVKEGRVRLGLWRADRRKPAYFDFTPFYQHLIGAAPVWVNDDVFLVVANPPGSELNLIDVNAAGFERIAEKRKAGWRDEAASVEPMGGGRYADLTLPVFERSLLRVDVRKNEVTALGVGDYRQIRVSPDGRLAAVIVRSDDLVAPDAFQPPNTFKGFREHHLFLYDLTTGDARAVCDACDVLAHALYWSDDSGELLFHARPRGESGSYYQRYSVRDGRAYRLHENPSPYTADGWLTVAFEKTQSAGWARDVAVFREIDRSDGRMDWIAAGGDGAVRNLTETLAPAPSALAALTEDAAFFVQDGGIVRVSLNGDVAKLPVANDVHLEAPVSAPAGSAVRFFRSRRDDKATITCIDAAFSTARSLHLAGDETQIAGVSETSCALAYAAFHEDQPSRFSVWGGAPAASPKQVHVFNAHLEGKRPRPKALRLKHANTLRGRENDEATSWLFLPDGAEADGSTPLVVIPYPMTAYTDDEPRSGFADTSWDMRAKAPYSMRLFTSAGYAVLLPSVGISIAYGDGLALEETDLGLDSIAPVLTAIDAAVSTGFVDDAKVAVSGHSYGGYLALMLAATTDRFAAVIATGGPYNLSSAYGASGPAHYLGRRAMLRWATIFEATRGGMGAPPWRDPDRYVRNSPLFLADRIDAPVMLIHGDLDTVDIAQASEMFSALYRQDKDVLYLRYWGENHWIVSPSNIRDMWARVFAFLQENGVAP